MLLNLRSMTPILLAPLIQVSKKKINYLVLVDFSLSQDIMTKNHLTQTTILLLNHSIHSQVDFKLHHSIV